MQIRGTIESLQGDVAVIRFEDGQQLRFPSSAIQGTPTVGSEIRIIAGMVALEGEDRQILARDLLNEILGL
jgi:hypothetical protein